MLAEAKLSSQRRNIILTKENPRTGQRRQQNEEKRSSTRNRGFVSFCSSLAQGKNFWYPFNGIYCIRVYDKIKPRYAHLASSANNKNLAKSLARMAFGRRRGFCRDHTARTLLIERSWWPLTLHSRLSITGGALSTHPKCRGCKRKTILPKISAFGNGPYLRESLDISTFLCGR